MDHDIIKPDIRTWVEAAISIHLHEELPVNKTHEYLVGRVLAQLLCYWRFEIPAKWRESTIDLDYTSFALRIKELASANSLPEHAKAIRVALESGTWEDYLALPEIVRHWIEDMTGLTLDEWTTIPEITERHLESRLRCPKCGLYTELRELGPLLRSSDPLAFSSTNALYFNCARCNTPLVYDTRPRPPRRPIFTKHNIKTALMVLILLAAGIQLCVYIHRYF